MMNIFRRLLRGAGRSSVATDDGTSGRRRNANVIFFVTFLLFSLVASMNDSMTTTTTTTTTTVTNFEGQATTNLRVAQHQDTSAAVSDVADSVPIDNSLEKASTDERFPGTAPPKVGTESDSSSQSSISDKNISSDSKSSTSNESNDSLNIFLSLFAFYFVASVALTIRQTCARARLNQMWASIGMDPHGLASRNSPMNNDARNSMGALIRNSSLGTLRMALALSGRDFRPEDYEMLQQLDRESTSQSNGLEEGTIRRFPLRKISALEVTRNKRRPRVGTAGACGTPGVQPTKSTHDTTIGINGDNSSDNLVALDIEACIQEDFQCSVCLTPYEAGDEVRTINCLHYFHPDCIDPWLRIHSTCPICKVDQM